jgi:hypothetical protein
MSYRPSTGSNVSDSRRKDVEGAVDHLVEREPGDDTAWVEVYAEPLSGNGRGTAAQPYIGGAITRTITSTPFCTIT